MKEKNQNFPKDLQLKMEFSSQTNKQASVQSSKIETGKVISLSNSNYNEKAKMEYSNLVIRNTKSF